MDNSAPSGRSGKFLGRVFPRFPETVAVEVYRQGGKIRVLIAICCVLLNLSASLSATELGLDRDLWIPLQVPNNILIVVSMALGLWLWKGGLSLSAARRVTFVCVVLEMFALLINLSLYGSVNSHMLLSAVFLVLVYRAVFDFRIGASAFALLFVGQWAVVIAEVSGLIPAQSGIVGRPDQIYLTARRELTGALFTSGILVLAFWAINWMVLRLRYKERAIRMLRATLAAAEPGKVGRHTGRTLQDTYVVGALLGTGGMGEVYRGSHRRSRRPVAIKLLHPHLIDDPVLLARFRREAEIVGSVGSDHIVELIDVDVDDEQPFLVFELLEGDNLQAWVMDSGPLAPQVAADLFTQIAAGLDAAHGAHIVHRDLKPENLIITETNGGRIVKILDFGISKIRTNATALTNEVALIGTPDFMSPEQAVGRIGEVDSTADIFALGAVLYYALTGRRPFAANSVPALLRRICDEEPPLLETVCNDLGDVGPGIAAVLAIAMAKRPSERYGSAGEFAADLRRAVAGELPDSVLERASAVHRGVSGSFAVGDAGISGTDATAHA